MILCDIHTHSVNSFDAKDTVDDMCKAAVDMGLYALAVTDHCEAPFINCGEDCEFGSFDRRIPQSLADVNSAREKYADKLKVLRGMELGEPMHDPAQTKKALNYGKFDFILASVHNIRGYDDFYYMDFDREDVGKILGIYFDELRETASFEHFDSLSHLTYPLRYIVERTGKFPDLSPYSVVIDDIFKILIKNNKALEVNVSGLFKPMGVTLPDLPLIKRYRELGGELVTLGTDAHQADMVGKGIDKGIELLRAAGFERYFIFENRKPIEISIFE